MFVFAFQIIAIMRFLLAVAVSAALAHSSSLVAAQVSPKSLREKPSAFFSVQSWLARLFVIQTITKLLLSIPDLPNVWGLSEP